MAKCICGHQGTKHLHLVQCPFFQYMRKDYLRSLRARRAKRVTYDEATKGDSWSQP